MTDLLGLAAWFAAGLLTGKAITDAATYLTRKGHDHD